MKTNLDMRNVATHAFAIALLSFSVSCSAPSGSEPGPKFDSGAALAPLKSHELLSDFSFIVEAMRAYYAPLEIKQENLSIDLNVLAARTSIAIENSSAEEEAAAYMLNFLSAFRDSHLSLSISNSATEIHHYSLGFETLLLRDRAVVVLVKKEAATSGVKDGDEVLSIDGLTPLQFISEVNAYKGSGTESARKSRIDYYAYRPAWFWNLRPKGDMAQVEILRNGSRMMFFVPWKRVDRPSKKLKEALGMSEGALESAFETQFIPYMITDKTKRTFGVEEIEPDATALNREGLKRADVLVKGKPFLRAYRYSWKRLKILLIRYPSFNLEDEFKITAKQQEKYLAAVLKSFEPSSDRVIVDLQGNGGGASNLATQIASYFTPQSFTTEKRLFNADRTWSLFFLNRANSSHLSAEQKRDWLEHSLEVDRAIQAGESLTRPLRLKNGMYRSLYPFKKPVLVLVDGRTVSAAELFAMYFQDHGWGKLMGTTTAGAGGSVEAVLKLPYSQWGLRVTRNLTLRIGSEARPRFIENEGIVPDFPYDPSIEDYRAGFIDYFRAVSDRAVGLVR